MQPYHELPGLDALYLEDSYVLDVSEEPNQLCFELETVLTEDHPNWSPPKRGEQYCYVRAGLIFPATRRVDWVEKPMQPVTGPHGETDYGNIDSFMWDASLYELTGEWGHVRIESDPPIVVVR